MKILLLFLVLLLPVLAHSQSTDVNKFPLNANGQIEFTEVVNTSLTKDKLYYNAQDWIAKTFGDYKKVIQFEDKENGKLIMKGISNVDYIARNDVSVFKESMDYTITIECKDNKFRYKIEDIIVNQNYKIGDYSGTIQMNPHKHLEIIDREKKEYENLKELSNQKKVECDNESKKSKRKKCEIELDNLSSKVELSEFSLLKSINFYNKEYDAITTLISSLKSGMEINDDF